MKERALDDEELIKTGTLHLVDLAGSESVGRSGAQVAPRPCGQRRPSRHPASLLHTVP